MKDCCAPDGDGHLFTSELIYPWDTGEGSERNFEKEAQKNVHSG